MHDGLDCGFSTEATAARLLEESTKARNNGEQYAKLTAEHAAEVQDSAVFAALMCMMAFSGGNIACDAIPENHCSDRTKMNVMCGLLRLA